MSVKFFTEESIKALIKRLDLEAQDYVNNLLKASIVDLKTKQFLEIWYQQNVTKDAKYLLSLLFGNTLEEDPFLFSLLTKFRFWYLAIFLDFHTKISVPKSVRKNPKLFYQALNLASIMLVQGYFTDGMFIMKCYTLEREENFFCLEEENGFYKLWVNNEFLFVVSKDTDLENFPIISQILAEGKVRS